MLATWLISNVVMPLALLLIAMIAFIVIVVGIRNKSMDHICDRNSPDQKSLRNLFVVFLVLVAIAILLAMSTW
jgi:hypothetical protein